MQGLDSSDAHSALTDATLTTKILSIIKKRQPNTCDIFLRTANKADTETIFIKEEIFSLNEYFNGN